MQIKVCEETHSTIRFVEPCPVCAEDCWSMIYTLNDSFLGAVEVVLFECPTDGPFSVTGTLTFTWTPEA